MAERVRQLRVEATGRPRRVLLPALKHVFGRDREEPLFRMRTSRGRPFRDYRCYYVNHYLIPADRVDVAALWEAWCARHTDWRVPPFHSMDEAQTFVAPFKRTEVVAS